MNSAGSVPDQLASGLQLSIIIPACNEEQRLPQSLESISGYLAKQQLSAEVIVVNDGSADRTVEVAESYRHRLPSLRILTTAATPQGKGCAVRTGMLAARGRVALFTDADLSIPIEETNKFLAQLGERDVAIASRTLDRRLIEVRQSQTRELAGRIFNFIVRSMTGLPFRDTQCGCKGFVMERARVLFEQQTIMGFGFDPEILFLAQRHGLRIAEIPVRCIHYANASKVRVLRDGLSMLADLLRIRWNAVRGLYPVRSKT